MNGVVELHLPCSLVTEQALGVGLDTLCRHNFGHNGIVRASSIMAKFIA